jgi:hypothetical protein
MFGLSNWSQWSDVMASNSGRSFQVKVHKETGQVKYLSDLGAFPHY